MVPVGALEMVSRNGALADIISSGARILESACGFCIGNSLAPKTNAVSVRTSNRNFFGRSGTNSADVYLTSPEAAVAAALSGRICDPRDLFSKESYPNIMIPSEFLIDDSMIIEPPKDSSKVQIVRGPNIGDPPSNEPCPQKLAAVVAIKVGDKITTDHIMPAGSRLKYRSNIPKYAEFVFEREAPQFAAQALANRNKGIHNVIVAGESYGQGSSREHAAICPMYLGVKMVVAKSIERIHRANLINFGIIPAILTNPEDYETLNYDDELVIDNLRDQLSGSNELMMINKTRGNTISLKVELTDRERVMILAGGLINATKAQR